MSTVTSVSLSSTVPTTNSNPSVTKSGTSSDSFTFLGVVSGDPIQVVLQAATAMDSARVNGSNNGAIVTTNRGTNSYLLLTVSTDKTGDWTVRARTSSDGSGNGMTFTAGTGGGFKK